MTDKVTTLMLFDSCGEEPPRFYALDGDYRHLHNVYSFCDLDEAGEAKAEEMLALIEKAHRLDEPTRDWTYFICCGSVP